MMDFTMDRQGPSRPGVDFEEYPREKKTVFGRFETLRPRCQKSLKGLLSGDPDARSPYEVFYYYTVVDLRAVRSGKWKLMFHDTKDGEVVALYDLENDIGETTNVIQQHPDVAERLEKFAERARDDLGDGRTLRKGKNCRPCGRVPAAGSTWSG